MFWKRVLTAVLIVPPLVVALWFLPAAAIVVLFGVVTLLAALELVRLLSIVNATGRSLYIGLILAVGAAGSVAALRGLPDAVIGMLAVATVWWAYLCLHFLSGRAPLGGIFATDTGKRVTGVMVLSPAWIAFVFLFVHDSSSPEILMYVLVLVWVADSAAYMAGRTFGRHKLAPEVSPGKTVEGALGALVAVGLFAVMAGVWVWHYRGASLIGWIVLALVTGGVSIIGDLTESALKRIAGVKDSGTLLPGHGGMFDRIDALTAAAPVFGLGWLLLQKVGQ